MTMDHLSGGRFILGARRVRARRWSRAGTAMPFAKPLARTREYVGIMRDIVARQGPRDERRARTTRCPYPDGTGPRQAAEVDDPPAARGHPDLPRRGGAEERRARGRDLRRLARALLLARATRTSTATRWPRASRARARGARFEDFEIVRDGAADHPRRRRAGGRLPAPVVRALLRRHGREGRELPPRRRRAAWATRPRSKKVQDLYLDGKKDEAAAAIPTAARSRSSR